MINKRALIRYPQFPCLFCHCHYKICTQEAFLRMKGMFYILTLSPVNHRNRINICLTTQTLMWCMWIFSQPLSHAEFINSKCFTCAPWEDTKSFIEYAAKKDSSFYFRGKRVLFHAQYSIQYTHASNPKGLKWINHVNRMFLFRLKINHVDFFLPIPFTHTHPHTHAHFMLINRWLLIPNLLKLLNYKSLFVIETDHTKSQSLHYSWRNLVEKREKFDENIKDNILNTGAMPMARR